MKIAVGTIVAALILFFWQFLSWNVLNVHGAEVQYTPNQDTILSVLSENLEDGEYFIPSLPTTATEQEYTDYMAQMEGKPWAKVEYHKAYQVNVPLNLVRGLVIDLFMGFLLIWILMKFKDNNFLTTVMASLAVGLIAYLSIPYMNSIWFESSTISYVVDWLVSWGLVGAWLGWWLNR